MGRPLTTGLTDMLGHYGARPRPALVLDWSSNELVQFSTQQQGFRTAYVVPYPPWPRVVDLSDTNPATAELPSIVLPWTAPLEVSESAEGKTIDVLARSTDKATLQEGFFRLEPRELKPPLSESELRSFPLAAAVSGQLTSFFKGKPIPEPEPSEADPAVIAPSEPALETSAATKLVVIGTSDFATDSQIRQFQENLVFFLNLVDWLTFGDELIGIRAKQAGDRPLRQGISETQRTAVKLANIVLLPLGVATFGLGWRALRRRRRGELPA